MTIDEKISKEDGPIMLSLFKGFSQVEIAKIVGVSKCKVKEIKERYKTIIGKILCLYQVFWNHVDEVSGKFIESWEELLNEIYQYHELPRKEIDYWENKYYEYKKQKELNIN